MKKIIYLFFGLSLLLTSCESEYSKGYKKGKSTGYKEGYSEGKKDGIKIGEEMAQNGISQTPTIVSGFVLFLIHLFMVGSIIAMIIFLFSTVSEVDDNYEKIYRISSVILAILLFFISTSLGKSIAELIITSIEISQKEISSILRKLSLVGVFGAITASIGHIVFKRKTEILERVIIIFATLLMLIFADLYVRGFKNPDNLLVNTSFIVGAFIYMIFFTRKPIS